MTSLKTPSPLLLPFLAGLFSAIIVASNFMAIKLVDVGCFTVPAAMLCYPFAFVCGDITTELFGFRTTRKVILFTFMFNAVIMGFLALAALLPPSRNFLHDDAFATIFLFAPRILVASFTAFIISGILNSFAFDALKRTGKFPLMARSSVSTAVGIIVDSIVFIGLAFGGTLPFHILWMTMLGQMIAKVVVGIFIGTPLTGCVLKCLFE